MLMCSNIFVAQKYFLFLIIIIFVTYTENNGPWSGSEECIQPQQGHRKGRRWDRVQHMSSAAVHCDLTRNVSQLLTYLRLLLSLPRSHPSATKDLNIK